MRPYDPNAPLIFIHVPKTGGTSVRSVFGEWFGSRLLPHYFDKKHDALPPFRDLEKITKDLSAPPVVYGHFNKLRGFGVEEYYPKVQQFITVLRDPFEMHLSRYFYARKPGKVHPSNNDVGDRDLEAHVHHGRLNMLAHFPRPMTLQNYRAVIEEFFVDIGCLEQLYPSLNRIASRLGKTSPDAENIPILNTNSWGDATFDHLRDAFRERFELEHAIYDYVRANQPDVNDPR